MALNLEVDIYLNKRLRSACRWPGARAGEGGDPEGHVGELALPSRR